MTCQADETVRIRAGFDPVILEVEAGFATNGRFAVDLRLPSGWQSVGRGDTADDIPDRYLLPADPDLLAGPETRLLILGNYAPAFSPTGRQVLVHYVFTQGGDEVHRTRIERGEVELLKCNHTYRFTLGG